MKLVVYTHGSLIDMILGHTRACNNIGVSPGYSKYNYYISFDMAKCYYEKKLFSM